MEKFITATFDTEERDVQQDIEVALNATNFAIVDGANPSMDAASYIAYLEIEHVEYGVYERPRRRPRN